MLNHPLMIGVAGGSGAGKTTFCKMIQDRIGSDVSIIRHDMYYKDLSRLPMEKRTEKNFDHPHAIDNELFHSHLLLIKKGKTVHIPEYDYVTHTRTGKYVLMKNPDTVLIEGIMLFNDQRIRDLFDYKVFIEVDSDIRFIRRLQRDLSERGRTLESVTSQWVSSAKPMHDTHVQPCKEYADFVVSGDDIDKAVARIVSFITKNIL